MHANTLTTRHGIAFVTNAAAGEYPMQWREVAVSPCELQIRTRSLQAPALLEKSRQRALVLTKVATLTTHSLLPTADH